MQVSAYVSTRSGVACSSSSRRCQRSARTTVASPYSAIAPTSAASSGPVDGSCGACCFVAHQTTPATDSSETARPTHCRREPPRRRGAGGGGDEGVGSLPVVSTGAVIEQG